MTEDELNAVVECVDRIPRVRFECGLGEGAENWLKKKHEGGCVHEPATLAAFLAIDKTLKPKVVFDVGALFGYFTLFALGSCPHVEEVVAFEMHPGSIGPLRLNVEPWARVVQAVVSDRCQQGELFWVNGFNLYEKPADGWEMLESVPGAMKPRGMDNRGRGYARLDMTTLDAWCARTELMPNLIKIDVEGYQAKAVAGAMQTIRAFRPAIIIELHDPEKLARFGVTNAQTVAPLFDLGYKAFWCGNFRGRDAKFEAVTQMDGQHERLSLMVFVP